MKPASRFWVIALAAISFGLTAQNAKAAMFTTAGSGSASGNPTAASADFSYAGGVLTIVLTNTSTFDYSSAPNSARAVPSDVLTGLFFDYDGGIGPSLSFDTATTPAITTGANPANLKLSSTPGGWDFAQSAASLPGVSQHYGLGTAGFGIFDGATSSGGPGHPTNYGVMNSLYNDEDGSLEGNPAVNGTPYAKDSITFKLSVGSFDVTKIGNVRFQYGTGLNENPNPVPAPGGLALVAAGVPALVLRRLIRRNAAIA